jgi:UDP-glucose 4-epimerase
MKRTVVVTGASGFIGRALSATLALSGVVVRPVSRSRGEGWQQLADYRDTPSADVLVHLAEANDRGRANAAGEAGYDAAIETMEAVLGKSYQRVIYASSSVLYGDAESRAWGPGDQVHVVDTYTRTKRQCERLVLTGKSNLVVRLANIYGPGMSANNVVSTILRQVPGTGDLCVWDASPIRDFLWIEDTVSALVAATTGEASGVFNLGSGVGYSIGDVARSALALCGEEHRPVRSTKPAARDSHLVLDIAETTRVLGWQPITHLNEGMGRLISHRLSN